MEIFEVLGGLGRFGRLLRAGLHGYGRSGRALERFLSDCWTASGGLLGGLGEVLGVMLGPKTAAKSGSYLKKCCSKRQNVPNRFLMNLVPKISSIGDHKICI